MPKIVPLRPKDVKKLLKNHGFVLNHTVGSHKQYFNALTDSHVTIPFHSKELPIGTLKSIIKQSKLSVDLFRR